MTNNFQKEIAALDQELYELYRGGSVDTRRIGQLWLQIELLEAQGVTS